MWCSSWVEFRRGCDLVDGSEAVEGAGVADERQQPGDDVDKQPAIIADMEVGSDVPTGLGVGAAEPQQRGGRPAHGSG